MTEEQPEKQKRSRQLPKEVTDLDILIYANGKNWLNKDALKKLVKTLTSPDYLARMIKGTSKGIVPSPRKQPEKRTVCLICNKRIPISKMEKHRKSCKSHEGAF